MSSEVRQLESGPVLIVQCSPNCGPCTKLTEAWPEISTLLTQTFPSLRLVKYTIEISAEKKIPEGLPTDLSRFQYWFPTILLIPGPIWDKALENPEEKLTFVKVFNAEIAEQKIKPVKHFETDAEGLAQFINGSFFEDAQFCKEQKYFTKTFVCGLKD